MRYAGRTFFKAAKRLRNEEGVKPIRKTPKRKGTEAQAITLCTLLAFTSVNPSTIRHKLSQCLSLSVTRPFTSELTASKIGAEIRRRSPSPVKAHQR